MPFVLLVSMALTAHINILFGANIAGHNEPMSGPRKENKTHHQHLLMAPTEVTAIDDWGFANRIRTRGEAIRRLCQIALAYDRHSPDLYKHYGAVAKAVGELGTTKARMWSGEEPIDLDRIGSLVDSLLKANVHFTGDMLKVAQTHVSMVAQSDGEDFEQLLAGLAELPDKL